MGSFSQVTRAHMKGIATHSLEKELWAFWNLPTHNPYVTTHADMCQQFMWSFLNCFSVKSTPAKSQQKAV